MSESETPAVSNYPLTSEESQQLAEATLQSDTRCALRLIFSDKSSVFCAAESSAAYVDAKDLAAGKTNGRLQSVLRDASKEITDLKLVEIYVDETLKNYFSPRCENDRSIVVGAEAKVPQKTSPQEEDTSVYFERYWREKQKGLFGFFKKLVGW